MEIGTFHIYKYVLPFWILKYHFEISTCKYTAASDGSFEVGGGCQRIREITLAFFFVKRLPK